MVKKKWLVTGGAGFIGSHLIEELLNQNQEVYCVDDLSSGSYRNLPKNHSFNFIKNKIQNIDNEINFNEISGVFHLAGQVSAPISIKEMYSSSSNNLMAMLKVWELSKHNQLPIVYASSSAVYGNKSNGNDYDNSYDLLSPYALDKITMENYADVYWNLYGIPSYGLRFFNVYGPRQDPSSPYSGVISIFIDRLLQNKSVVVNGGEQTRDFIYVKDVVRTAIKAMEKLKSMKTCSFLNVGTGYSSTINSLLATISKLLKVTPEITYKKQRQGDPLLSICKIDKLISELQLPIEKFYNLERGLRNTIKDKIKEN